MSSYWGLSIQRSYPHIPRVRQLDSHFFKKRTNDAAFAYLGARLCDSDTASAVLRWVHTVSPPEMDRKAIGHQQLLRTMDAIIAHQSVIFLWMMMQLTPKTFGHCVATISFNLKRRAVRKSLLTRDISQNWKCQEFELLIYRTTYFLFILQLKFFN